jgi:hypothetical protein
MKVHAENNNRGFDTLLPVYVRNTLKKREAYGELEQILKQLNTLQDFVGKLVDRLVEKGSLSLQDVPELLGQDFTLTKFEERG